MNYIHVIVEEPSKVLYEAAVNIAHIVNSGTFNDLLFEITNDQFLERNIQVFGREKKSDKWTMLQDRLDDYLQALVQLDFKMVRFLLESNELQESIQPELPDVNVLLMSNAKQLYFPEKLTRGNNSSKECWAQIIPEIFNFVAMMRKYADHLQKLSQLTNNSYNSTELVRMPSKNCSLKTILGSLNINSNYKELQKNLATKDPYSFIEIFEFLPSQCIERHK
ncbi:16528_t:CDS:2 [Dentiscutata erythropus]|uniref:16528_t:CDS:1 n=1 Tax=Dentiscutata erythropus TaxID=1348616 RepID=A0A9N9B7Z7_9GLOM|nr:16528_t:CDS:2 [Dentiscutata erythropus]